MRETRMTRQHFELIASIINSLDLKPVNTDPHAVANIRLHIAHEFSRVMETSNQGFNREMFINACTVSDRKRADKRQVAAAMKAGGAPGDVPAFVPPDAPHTGPRDEKGKLTKRAFASAAKSADPTTWNEPADPQLGD